VVKRGKPFAAVVAIRHFDIWTIVKTCKFSGFVESGKRLNEWSPSAAVETILPRMLPVLAYPSSGACSHPGGKSREFHIG
jgi:hypothetical protein